MIYPTKKFILILCIPFAISLLVLPIHLYRETMIFFISSVELMEYLLYIEGILILIALIDGLRIPNQNRFKVYRQCDAVFSQEFAHKVTLIIDFKKGSLNSLTCELFDDESEEMLAKEIPPKVIISAGRNSLTYKLQILTRGNHHLHFVHLTAYSFLKLAKKVHHLPCYTSIKVYPDLKVLSRYELLARKSRLGMLGIRRVASSGGDNDFERLRDYNQDDEYKHIDWKSTAKRNHLIVRTYQISQNQNIIFLLDCGRMMTPIIQSKTLLDYAARSTLLLARVALKQGDRVGMMGFSNRIHRYVEPAPGNRQHRRLIQSSYDLSASMNETDFSMAFQHLNRVHRKRSLIVVLTNIIDDQTANSVRDYMSSSSRRHLPLIVLLKHRDIEELLAKPPADEEELFHQAAAANFLLWREKQADSFRNRGTLVLEALPEELDSSLINEYLKIKARNLL